jgi:protein SCO1/2
VTEKRPPRSTLKTVRLLLWALVALAVLGTAALLLLRRGDTDAPQAATTTAAGKSSFGGPFTLTDGNGRRFSSQALAGKPYAMFFGFTRCGDVCPTTLARLTKLRREAASDEAMNILFVTIDPKNDGPKEVGQYSTMFNAPIIGLTGTEAEIAQVKKQYGIFAQPSAHALPGQEMEHTGTVLLFDRKGELAGTISASESDADVLAKMKAVTA